MTLAYQTCIECSEKFQSADSDYYRNNLCQKCGSEVSKKPLGLVNKLVSEMNKNGGYKASPPEGGNNRCGKKKYH